jgi:hypothetical protein
MLITPISGWWALITGAISLIAWVITPSDTISVSKVLFLIIIVIVSFIVWVGFSVALNGWKLYSERNNVYITQTVEYENERVFLLKGMQNVRPGSVLEVYRKIEALEVAIGLIEVFHEKENREVQARPIWIMPVHLQAIKEGKLSVDNLIVQCTLSKNTLLRWVDEQAERKLQDALKRGGQE